MCTPRAANSLQELLLAIRYDVSCVETPVNHNSSAYWTGYDSTSSPHHNNDTLSLSCLATNLLPYNAQQRTRQACDQSCGVPWTYGQHAADILCKHDQMTLKNEEHTSRCVFHWPAQVLSGEELEPTAELKALTAHGLRRAMHIVSDVASAAHLFMLGVKGSLSSSFASSKHAPSFWTYSCGSSAGF